MSRVDNMSDQMRQDATNRVPTFPIPGLILLGPGNTQVACNAEAVRILAYPNATVNAKRVNALIAEKIPAATQSNGAAPEGIHVISELHSGRRRYLCSRYTLDMHGPQPLRTTAILLERAGSPDVTMYELFNRFNLTAR